MKCEPEDYDLKTLLDSESCHLKNIKDIPWRLPAENINQENLNLKFGLSQLKP